MSDAATSNAAPTDLIELGRITAAYGVKGWVKVQPHSANAEVLLSASQWWLTRPVPELARGAVASAPVVIKVLQARSQGATVVAQLAGIADRDQAEAMRGYSVQAPRGSFPAPEEDEYYWVDLIGCALYTSANGEPALIGVVDEVLDNGAHAVLKVLCQKAGAEGPEPILTAKGRPAEMLVPFVRAHIHAVDLAARRIDSDWPADL
ncbi:MULTISPECIES: ribosome maturation factor RimM [Achromobacter]|jgi:16S rRNA processing protein RimM|uniref:Ribosome maturation factor RimM n=2 Tax=Achromobacter kerstersii TaxID=1353890 RepID=A0A6S6ZYG4_9BURK|nr:ribosome maturation factor RimM [Achromobacter kerstersii]CAB3697247.1 Ribosome maturation factor RimM [Achromobacter kerstersii]CUJ64388.1 Ribosome maturation factor rimM [Achromobacter kerstersii]